jgi:hypothetical protein
MEDGEYLAEQCAAHCIFGLLGHDPIQVEWKPPISSPYHKREISPLDPLKRKEKACKARENLCGPVGGCCETQFCRSKKDTTSPVEALVISNCARHLCASMSLTKRFRQFGRAEHICDALEVVCHRREADFDPCTGQPPHEQTRMPEDTVLDRREGMLDRAST